ncbi:MAG TPA: glycosyl hydrolase [Bacteroidales bacterium]|nr:glycosyl hydrolase [Bacteroidales bacterium]
MPRRTNRLLITLLAIVAGIAVVLILSMAGDRSRGPVANLLRQAGRTVAGIEDRFIHKKRVGKRMDKLQYLEGCQQDISRLKDPRVILMGAYDNRTSESFASIIDLEDTLGTTFPLVHIYSAWGDKPEEQFPRAQVKAIMELGSIPVITWEPWLSDFEQKNYPGLASMEERDKGGLATIASGMFDEYITAWAEEAAELGRPIFLRLGHEMNDPYRYPWGPHNNTPETFIEAWRHVFVLFKAAKADNVIWIWSPHPSYGMFNEFYPGEYFVDYIGINVLNYGDVASWSKWWSFDEIILKAYPELSQLNKPIMISELGCLSVGGNRADWYREAFSSIATNYPRIKAVLFFHYSEDRTTTPQAVDWTLEWDRPVTTAIRQTMRAWPDSLRMP